MTEQPSPPASTATANDEPIHVDPAMVLTRVQQSGDLGNALVRAAVHQVLAEHHAAENASLREQLAAARAELAGGGDADSA